MLLKCHIIQTKFMITNNFYSHQRFSHHRQTSSGTELSLFARWRDEQTVPHDM